MIRIPTHPITIIHRRCFSYGRMIDMGGAPSALSSKNSTRINTSKNMNIQGICFEFEVLTRSVKKPDTVETARMETTSSERTLGDVKPNQSMIHEVANLLNVPLGGVKKTDEINDDLSLLTGEKEEEKSAPAFKNPLADIRAKYADKLAKRGVEGGVSSVELAKQQVEDTLKRGDALGHLAARKIAISEPVSASKKWMALTGTGKLLRYLATRSIKIALLPRPAKEVNAEELERMDDFRKQLSEVTFDVLYKKPTNDVDTIVDDTVNKLKLEPKNIMFVSDRDDYLKAAKDKGLVTCRILPKNGRRGNISAHYNVEDVPAVEEALNEINGISFNAVLKG